MEEKLINQEMAKLDGWREIEYRPHPLDEKMLVLSGQYGSKDYVLAIPKYFEDLNGVWNVVENLDDNSFDRYLRHLTIIRFRDVKDKNNLNLKKISNSHATAPQHCEAVLRAAGKWIE